MTFEGSTGKVDLETVQQVICGDCGQGGVCDTFRDLETGIVYFRCPHCGRVQRDITNSNLDGIPTGEVSGE